MMRNFVKPSPNHALKAFNSGFNCAQSVVKVYAEAFGFNEGQALALSSGFGGGMGGMQGTCGAVTGAYMVLGMFCAGIYTDNHERKACSAELVRAFNQKFTDMHQTDECRTLLNQKAAPNPKRTANLNLSLCENYIVNAVEILNGLMEESF